jgi:hypothetical protein
LKKKHQLHFESSIFGDEGVPIDAKFEETSFASSIFESNGESSIKFWQV